MNKDENKQFKEYLNVYSYTTTLYIVHFARKSLQLMNNGYNVVLAKNTISEYTKGLNT